MGIEEKKDIVYNSAYDDESIDRAGEVDIVFSALGKNSIQYADEGGLVNDLVLDFIMDYGDSDCPILNTKQKAWDLKAKGINVSPDRRERNYTAKLEFQKANGLVLDHSKTFLLSDIDAKNWDIKVESDSIYLLKKTVNDIDIPKKGLLVYKDHRTVSTTGFLVTTKKDPSTGMIVEDQKVNDKDGNPIKILMDGKWLVADDYGNLLAYTKATPQGHYMLLNQFNVPHSESGNILYVKPNVNKTKILTVTDNKVFNYLGNDVFIERSYSMITYSVTFKDFYFKTEENQEGVQQQADVSLSFYYGDGRAPFFLKHITGNSTIKYKFEEEMKMIPLHAVVSAGDTHASINRPGVLINNNRDNSLVIQLMNISGGDVIFEPNSTLSLFIPVKDASLFSLSPNTSGYIYSLTIGSNPQVNISSSTNEFTATLSAKQILKQGESITITIDGIRTNLSPRNSFIQFNYTKATGFANGHAIIPVSVQPFIIESDKVTAYFNNNCIELSEKGYRYFDNSDSKNPKEIITLREETDNSAVIKVYNNDGKSTLMFQNSPDGGKMFLNDNSGGNTIQLNNDGDGGVMQIFNKSGKQTIKLVNGPVGGRMYIRDQNEQTAIKFNHNDNGGVMQVFNQNGKQTIELINTSEGGNIHLNNASGNKGLELLNLSIGGQVQFFNKNNNGLLYLYCEQDGGRIKIYDTNGKEQIQLFSTGTGGQVNVNNTDGGLAASIGLTTGTSNGHKYGHLHLFTNNGSTDSQRTIVELDGNDEYGDGGLWLYGNGSGNDTPKVRISSWEDARIYLRGNKVLSK